MMPPAKMSPYSEAKQKFLQGSWYCYRLEDWDLPHCTNENYSLLQFVRCFEDFSPYYSLECCPYAFEDLLCVKLLIKMKPEAAELLKKKNTLISANNRAKKRSRKAAGARKSDADKENYVNEGNVKQVNREVGISRKPQMIKLCLSQDMELLFVSRHMSQWLQQRVEACLGVRGQAELLTTTTGDPRHMLQLRLQRGVETDGSGGSRQALMEHEWQAALRRRGRQFGAPLGSVTRVLGAMPDNFPQVQHLTVRARQVPAPKMVRCDVDIAAAELRDCRKKLSTVTLDDMTVRLSSPSVLHLYYNTSYERHRAQEAHEEGRGPPVAGAAGYYNPQCPGGYNSLEVDAKGRTLKRRKPNVEGVVMKAPLFMQSLRAAATLRPVMEYQLD